MIRDTLRSALERELAELETGERPRLLALLGSADGWDAADRADRIARERDLAQLDARIAHLRQRLLALDEGRAGGDRLGEVSVAVDFGDGPETYLLGEFSYRGLPVITPASPLGRALVGARSGQVVTYDTPRGAATVVVLAVHVAEARAA
jgi:transcription elongation GreA/GreB family factor